MFPFKGNSRNNSTKLTREDVRTKGKRIGDVRYISNLLIDYNNLRYKINNKTIHIIINTEHKIIWIYLFPICAIYLFCCYLHTRGTQARLHRLLAEQCTRNASTFNNYTALLRRIIKKLYSIRTKILIYLCHPLILANTDV